MGEDMQSLSSRLTRQIFCNETESNRESVNGCSSSGQHMSLEEGTSPSSNGSDPDYCLSKPSSNEDKVLSFQSFSNREPDKDISCSSSSEDEVLETKDRIISKRRKLQSLKKTPQVVTVVTTKKNRASGRIWNKFHYCFYCKEPNIKIARHLEKKHKDEADVVHAFSFPFRSKQRKILLESIRNKGDLQHNVQVLRDGNGDIVIWKQPSKEASVKDYLPCQHCFAMFKRTAHWKHEESCRHKTVEKKNRKRKRVQKASSQLTHISKSSAEFQEVIHNMRHDDVTSHIPSDKMICTFGNALFAKKGHIKSQHRYITQKMRELGRFVLAAKKLDKSVEALKDICSPEKFDLAIEAARRVSNYSTSTTEYGRPSTAVKIGFSLKGATEAWIGHCLKTSDVLTEKKAKKFKELLEDSWSTNVSISAYKTMRQRRWNKYDCVTLTEDIITLQSHLRKVEDEAKAKLTKRVSTTAYKRLRESLLTQIIVFNRKYEREASSLTLETYLKADTGPVNKDIYETLSPVEKQMSHRLTRIVTRGQRRTVSILLIERTKTSLDFLIKKRREAGILDDNPYVFARIGTTTNIRGCDCLRKYAEECKASKPELLQSTKQREYIATVSQLLDLDNQELEQVAHFVGHDIQAHCDYHCQTHKTFQVAKIGKVLFAMERRAKLLKGKNLKEMDSVIFGEEECSPASRASKRRTTAPQGPDEDDNHDLDKWDGEEQNSTVSRMSKMRRTAPKRQHDGDEDDNTDINNEDGQEHHCTALRPAKIKKSTANKQDLPKIQKQQWTDEERTAIQKSTNSFIVLRVPGKKDYLLCIGIDSPVVSV